jgi:hypothetical protein
VRRIVVLPAVNAGRCRVPVQALLDAPRETGEAFVERSLSRAIAVAA